WNCISEKKRIKTYEQPSSPVQEEPEPVSCVLQGDEIQALAIKLEDLEKKEKEKIPVTKKYLIRKSKPQEVGKKSYFLVAYPTTSDETKKSLQYSEPAVDNFGYILPHSILGTLQEFKQEATKRGQDQVGFRHFLLRNIKAQLLELLVHISVGHIWAFPTGTRPSKYLSFHRTWEKSLFLKQRRNELKDILEKLDFYNPVWDPLAKYPDVVLAPVLGPSLKFCEQPARWINTTSEEGEVGIAARVTFEILVGEKAESLLTVSNDGTAAIWYDWRRLPQPFSFQEKKRKDMQNFYFNTRSGVILPRETRKFSFIFKAINAGIFTESWEFGTRPVLLGGAMLQVTLWGIALPCHGHTDERMPLGISVEQVAVIVEENLKDLLDRIRVPERPRSPHDAYVTEEELFHRMNPELYYQHQVVKELYELWNKLMNPPPYEEEMRKSTATQEEASLPKSGGESRQKSPDELPRKSVSPDDSSVRKSMVEELAGELSRSDVEDVNRMEDINRVEWRKTVEKQFPFHCSFQLWREVIDGLVSRSLVLRSLLGMPEKDTYVEMVPEEVGELLCQWRRSFCGAWQNLERPGVQPANPAMAPLPFTMLSYHASVVVVVVNFISMMLYIFKKNILEWFTTYIKTSNETRIKHC
uniref:MYCBP associated protein n=1 Tax=Podarcis muralis TaxID=64176 RepID=A0A670JBL7_PODMU